MPKQENRKQASQYDKITKENLDITLPVIIRDTGYCTERRITG